MSEINTEEYTICKRRGHEPGASHQASWMQCMFCGVWLREVRTIEEREDAPPDNERSMFSRMRTEAKAQAK
jgi:hypothetical protein